jgi:DNA adenine methylase
VSPLLRAGSAAVLFKVLWDQKEKLVEAIGLTPFSRQEFYRAVSADGNLKRQSGLERARLFFVRARQARTGLAQTASLGRWANCKNTSRAGMSGAVSRWLGSVADLPEIALCLLRVQIENRPAIEIVPLYDDQETLFYCDPPYVHSTRGDEKAYGFEMKDAGHRDLAQVLSRVKGKVAISGYRCDLMKELYKDWRCVEAPPKNCHSIKKMRTEALWTNY